ncbi:MAG: RdgB/HAM1 family non-canonical purine NTP pyrophosphatase [Acidobacteriales bacterium]|nr:RdgB/HAM1 family non-canonical purine NTP pyrophosphatase [Terriglobales bacterium]
MRIFIASSNSGKLRELSEAGAAYSVVVHELPGSGSLPVPAESGSTFAENAAIKAVAYSRTVPGEIVIADDSGLEVSALGGAPGIHSARYAQQDNHKSSDAANNQRLLCEIAKYPGAGRSALFVCVIAAARDGKLLGTFEGEARGEILQAPLGRHGFGYDPLFFVPEANKTFAEMQGEEKLRYSHRGAAFRQFCEWLAHHPLS